MRNVLNPKWLIIVNTIPVLILFMIYLGAYQIIKSLLPEDSLRLWLKFGSTLAVFSMGNLVYAIILIIKKKYIHTLYGLTALIVYTSFLYTYVNYADDIIPRTIPRWMIPANMELYVGTFLMPTLAMALFILVAGFSKKQDKPGINFAIAILIPVSWYVFFQAILPFWQLVEYGFSTHLFIIFIIIGTLLFLFFFSRGVYILSLKKSERWKAYQFAWKITVAILFPLLGLALSYSYNVLGDFTHPWFFILAVVNGILVCLPNITRPLYRLILFSARSITLPYITYFFLVFLPYLPLSVLVIIVFGLGFLMLTPLILLMLQSRMTIYDFRYLHKHYSKPLIFALFIGGIMVLPLSITISYLQDKKALYAALDYVYEPNLTTPHIKAIKTKSLRRVLEKVQYHKSANFGMLAGDQMPFLSPYYNWLVLDNLMLSNAKVDLLQSIFLGTKVIKQSPTITRVSDNIKITNVKVNSNYDTQEQAWKSWIDLEITNFDTLTWQSEFVTSFELPEGAWISDYYLWVNGIKKPGILAEKKTATWIYDQITRTRQDPGILYYTSGNKITFKIFPFRVRETRKTGFEILHKEPIQLIIDNHILSLGNTSAPSLNTSFTSADGSVTYIPAQFKKQLPVVQRTPYFHFIIDGSTENEAFTSQSIERIKSLLNKKLLDTKLSRFTINNTYTKTFDYSSNWQKEIEQHIYAGGFYLERAVKQILLEHYNKKSTTYPIIVVVTNDLSSAILPKDFVDFKITFPENELFFELEQAGILLGHSLISEPSKFINSAQLECNHKVLAYPDTNSPMAYLPINNKPDIVITSAKPISSALELTAKNWECALTLNGKWLSHQIYPSQGDRAWLHLVKGSFSAHIMTPVTSFIVVENKAQEAALKTKQAKVLAAKQSLDLGEDTEQMSEPGLLLLAGILIFILYLFKRSIVFKAA